MGPSCGTGTVFGAIKGVGLAADETVAVFGQGPVGLSVTLLAKAFGARVIAVDVEPSRLEMAKKFGADHVVDAREQDSVAAVRALTREGAGVDKSIVQCQLRGASSGGPGAAPVGNCLHGGGLRHDRAGQ